MADRAQSCNADAFTGPRTMKVVSYVQDVRRLFRLGHDLVGQSGGQVFIHYTDAGNRVWSFCSDDAQWAEYKRNGIHPAASSGVEVRYDKNGSPIEMCQANLKIPLERFVHLYSSPNSVSNRNSMRI